MVDMKIIDNILKIVMSVGIVIIAVVFVPSTILTSCIHFPELKDFPKNTPKSCIRHERCLYYAAKGKIKLDCSLSEDKCSKTGVFLDYDELGSSSKLPEVYDNSGAHKMTFQEYWDKVK